MYCVRGPPGFTLTDAGAGHTLNYMVQRSGDLDRAFTALGDPTRRGILERLAHAEASISDLAAAFDMSLTGVKKHVMVLEAAGLVTTAKVGRVRTCRVGPRRLDDEIQWITRHRRHVAERLDQLADLLERTPGAQ